MRNSTCKFHEQEISDNNECQEKTLIMFWFSDLIPKSSYECNYSSSSEMAWYILSGPVIFQSNKNIDELKMAQAAQHETGNFFNQHWIVTLCLRDVLWIYLKKKNFILVIREFLFLCDF